MGSHLGSIPDHIKEELGLKSFSQKNYTAVLGNRNPIQFRSTWEYYYAIFLEKLYQERKIRDWLYEPQPFFFDKIKRGTRGYLPDFLIIHLNGSQEFCEVKGYMDDKSRVKLKRMAKYYPEVKIRVVDATWFKNNLDDCKAIEHRFVKLLRK